MSAATLLRHFHGYKTALLTTYRRDGMRCVSTPVSIVVDRDRVLFRTWADSGKAKRLRAHPVADLRPCTFRGRPTGPAVRCEVRLLDGDEEQRAARMLGRRHPFLQRWAVPISHRMLRYRTLHYELRPVGDETPRSAEGWPD
ncbi:hypothetical protein HNR23_004282 [Nocardiopsis mwathae]|uniref:PPOX class F420-dependent oxidoreductase n=1 Tax=Nocardiopsis mwathae TaxID=1472723 RepID=A0A7W9YL81_9ACTN|nr:PPOX class F420-dependent oxidoreductase [Nocardiopsis mwathae]MBB6174222.1 hypothetical protein [Nocardiopsis mwathae]